MSQDKKQIRASFRQAVFQRAKYACQGPGCHFKSSPGKAEKELDAHHITPRTNFLHGGYVKENGIALCSECHLKAEAYYSGGVCLPEFLPKKLYQIIQSNWEKAQAADDNQSQ